MNKRVSSVSGYSLQHIVQLHQLEGQVVGSLLAACHHFFQLGPGHIAAPVFGEGNKFLDDVFGEDILESLLEVVGLVSEEDMDGVPFFFLHGWHQFGFDVPFKLVIIRAADGEIDVRDLILDGVDFFHIVPDLLLQVVNLFFD